MKQSIVRWTIYLAALFALGPLAGQLTARIHAPDGGPGASVLVSASPALALALTLAAFALAAAAGLVAARLINTRVAAITAGLVLVWSTWRMGTVSEVLRAARSGSPLGTLAVEGLILGAAGICLASLLHTLGRHDAGDERPSLPGKPRSLLRACFACPHWHLVILVGVVAGAVAAWFVAQTPLKGQAVGAAIVAGLFGAAAARLADLSAPMPLLFVPPTILAILGPLSGLALGGSDGGGSGGALSSSFAGTLFPLAEIMPLDWIAGAFIGVPMGMAWAGSMLDKRVPERA